MSEDVKKLLLQVDANVELMRRNLASGTASLDGFERRADAMATRTEGSFSRIGLAAAKVGAALAGMVAAAGIGAIASVGKQMLDLADDMATIADVANINVERYQTLREGLRKLEVSADQTDMVLKRLTDTLGAVQGGTASDSLLSTLDKMGVTTRILSGEITTTDQLLDAIAGSARKFGSAAEYTAAVIDIVGRKGGADLAAALRDGGAALHEQEQAFRDAGAVISEEYIKKLADANEVLDAMAETGRNKMIIWAADTVEALRRVMAELDRYSLLQKVAMAAGSPMGFAGKVFFDSRGQADLNQKFGLGGLRAREADDRARINGLPAGSDARRELERRFRDTYQKPFDEDESFDIVVRAGKLKPEKEARAAKLKTPKEPNGLTLAEVRRGLQSGDWAAADVSALREKLAGAFETEFDVRIRLERDGTRELLETLDEELQPRLEKLQQDIDAPFRRAAVFGEDLSRNLAQALVHGQNLGAALANSFRAAAAEAISSGLFRLLLGDGTSGRPGLFGTALAGLFSGLGFAAGGRPPVGRASWVGERGRELFVPDVPGTIIPNGALGGAALTFDLRGAVMTADLLAQMEAMAAQGAGVSLLAARQHTNSALASAARRRLPRAAGAA